MALLRVEGALLEGAVTGEWCGRLLLTELPRLLDGVDELYELLLDDVEGLLYELLLDEEVDGLL